MPIRANTQYSPIMAACCAFNASGSPSTITDTSPKKEAAIRPIGGNNMNRRVLAFVALPFASVGLVLGGLPFVGVHSDFLGVITMLMITITNAVIAVANLISSRTIASDITPPPSL
jgi:hypothetical protein